MCNNTSALKVMAKQELERVSGLFCDFKPKQNYDRNISSCISVCGGGGVCVRDCGRAINSRKRRLG